MFQLLSAWGAIVFGYKVVRQLFNADRETNWKYLGLSTLSGLLLWLGFPTMPFTPLMFVGLVPILILENDIAKNSTSPKLDLLKYSYHAFIVWNILSTFWVANTAYAAGLFAFIANSALMCIPILGYHIIRARQPRLRYAAFVSFWLTFELFHLWWDLSWTWLNLGNAFAQYPSWVQWYEITGVFGGSTWILVMNVLAYIVVDKLWVNKQALSKSDMSYPLALLVLPIVVSVVMYNLHEEQGKSVEVVVVQPNYEPHYEKFNVKRRTQINNFLQLSQSQVTASTDYLVFPETSFHSVEIDKATTNRTLSEFNIILDSFPNLKLITGVGGYNKFEKGEPHSSAVREYVRGKDTTYLEAINGAVQVQSGKETPYYVKGKLVPGAEKFPFKEWLGVFKPIVKSLGGTYEGHAKSTKRVALVSETGRIAPVICYESVDGQYHAGYVKQAGAQASFIMTNDGWWDDTPGHKQHLAFASLRAIETRRAIARSANTGISAFINQRGDIRQTTNYDEAIAIKGEIQLNNEVTTYTIWGDLIGRVSLFLTILLILNTISKGLVNNHLPISIHASRAFILYKISASCPIATVDD